MNPLSPDLKTGTIGELLVQLRLLQYDVQAVAPHKDTGNDLIAVHGDTFRAVQIKTSATDGPFTFDREQLLQRRFHVLALVRLAGEDRAVALDQSKIYLLSRDDVRKGRYTDDELQEQQLSEDRVRRLFRAGNAI